jgi:hypothetical protein
VTIAGTRAGVRLAGLALACRLMSGGDPLPAAERPGDDGTVIDRSCPVARASDVPAPRFTAIAGSPASRPPLRRVRDLTRDFIEGGGRQEGPALEAQLSASRLMPLPWRGTASRSRASGALRWESPTGLEYLAGFVLPAGARWCSPELDLDPDTRLRFEAASPEGAVATLDVSWSRDRSRAPLIAQPVSRPSALAAARQTELLLPAERGSVCFEARDGMVFVGEGRILAPEAPSADPRPRWVVLVVVDTLRADVLQAQGATGTCPELEALARRGLLFTRAASNGCHTQAALFPLLTGRDLTRTNPAAGRAVLYEPARPLSRILARANLPISLLAEEAGYHSVFLGNNAFINAFPLFSRYSGHTRPQSGTGDAAQRLGDLVARYADERLFLLHWISAPHAQSATPRRLVEALGCAGHSDLTRCDCMYAARARHGDEALGALERAIEKAGRAADSLQIITSDHGELLGHELESWLAQGGATRLPWSRHGSTCHPKEVQVPLVVVGPRIRPGRSAVPVSTLDIEPSLLRAMGGATVNLVDGAPLPLDGGAPADSRRRLVAHGFCVQSTLEDDLQFFWWNTVCPHPVQARAGESTGLVDLWRRGRLDRTASRALLRHWLTEQRTWVVDRLHAEALILDPAQAGRVRLHISTIDGTITDYGPAGPVGGLARIEAVRLQADRKALDLTFDHYPGWFHVTTSPPLARVRVQALDVGARPTVFVGPQQLPLDLLDREVNPRANRDYFVAAVPPDARRMPVPSLRLWWQSARGAERREQGVVLSELNRVLREWGYVR